MIKILHITMVLFSLIFLFTNHPLILCLILVLQTLAILLLTGLMSQSFWFSYILFLVSIGGMLILFIYIMSLIFNKMMLQKINYKIIFIYLIIIIFSHYMPMLNNINTLEMNITYNEYPEMINLIKLYNFPMNLINIFMINYLMTLLIIVVKITNFSYGPMRMKI